MQSQKDAITFSEENKMNTQEWIQSKVDNIIADDPNAKVEYNIYGTYCAVTSKGWVYQFDDSTDERIVEEPWQIQKFCKMPPYFANKNEWLESKVKNIIADDPYAEVYVNYNATLGKVTSKGWVHYFDDTTSEKIVEEPYKIQEYHGGE